MEVIKELKGYSGSKIFLMKDNQKLFVRKIGNVARNNKQLGILGAQKFNVPKIYHYDNEYLDIEYIHGLDMTTYLESHSVELLKKFIFETLDRFAETCTYKDYTDVYIKKLHFLDDHPQLPFSLSEFLESLPKSLPSSIYHGDLTLDNILCKESTFYMIDAVEIEYDSYVFDIAKMRQDLECKWFLRHNHVKIDIKLQNLQNEILKRYPLANNDNLLILMLLRVLPYAVNDQFSYDYLIKEIKRLWK
jgi:RIO-like serine/threonine protein kinase